MSERPGPLQGLWSLDPEVDFLNHGSFGACPLPVLEKQQELRDELERQPVDFFVRKLEARFDDARERLAAFVGADAQGLVAVPNATTGVNAVLRSMRFAPGDQLLTTNHEYNACRNALDFVAQRWGAEVVVAKLPFVGATPEGIFERISAAITPQTRIALIDHITSQTGMVLPIARIVEELNRHGADSLIDGAHAPGMLPLELDRLGATYYTGNCHKWICAPKGAAFLWVAPDRREHVRPLTISHGANSPRPGRSRFHDEFDWMGTSDPTAFLCVPRAIDCLGSLFPNGWDDVRHFNNRLALTARTELCGALELEPPCPDSMIGSLAALPLPDGSPEPPRSALYADALQDVLLRRDAIEVPIIPWPAPPKRLLRISAQLYNRREQYERLGQALRRELF